MTRTNEFGQPIGPDLGSWVPPEAPAASALTGRNVELHILDPEAHAVSLFERFRDAPDSLWTYMPFGPFASVEALRSVVLDIRARPDWLPYAILVDGEVLGFLSYLRIDPGAGAIEIGSIVFAPPLQRTAAATEALYLVIQNTFDLGYRRCEWKCDAFNAPSMRAAERLGFRYEGTFRNATHYKGRSRDTAWFAITDGDWPELDQRFVAWLDPSNFDANGAQRTKLRPQG